MTVISLTTDFGLADGFVGFMKGVILRIAPHVRFVDLTHEIAPKTCVRPHTCLPVPHPTSLKQQSTWPWSILAYEARAVRARRLGARRLCRPGQRHLQRRGGWYRAPKPGDSISRVLAAAGQPDISWPRHLRPSGGLPREWRLAGATRPANRRSCAPRLGRSAPLLRWQPERRDHQHRPLWEFDLQHPCAPGLQPVAGVAGSEATRRPC